MRIRIYSVMSFWRPRQAIRGLSFMLRDLVVELLEEKLCTISGIARCDAT